MERPLKARKRTAQVRISKNRLAAMIEAATLDAYGELEQASGWHSMLDQHLVVPFAARVLGVDVTVVRIDLRDDGQIVAICARGSDRQAIDILDLPLPSPPPKGAEWITAYRCWLRGE